MAWFFFDETEPPAYLSDELFLEVIFREVLIGGDGLDVFFVDPDVSFTGTGTAIAALVTVKRQAGLIPFWFFYERFHSIGFFSRRSLAIWAMRVPGRRAMIR